MVQAIKRWLQKRLFDEQKILLAFEYGVVLAETAKTLGVEVNEKLVLKAEEMIKSEFKDQDNQFLANNMNVNLLSAFETDASKNSV